MSIGLEDTAQAQRNIELLTERLGPDALAGLMPGLLGALSSSADSDMALNNLERFAGAITDVPLLVSSCRSRSGFLTSLITIFGASNFLSSFLIALADEALSLLSAPGYLASPMGQQRLAARLVAMAGQTEGDKEYFRIIRTFRKQELLRIGLRDLLGRAELPETVAELSDLAEVCLRHACGRVDSGLRKRYGRPVVIDADGKIVPAGFCVIAMGKLGGGELNFSSDVDLMYVYSSDGETEGLQTEGVAANRISNHQYFIKLAEKLTAAIGENTEDGFVFRVDLRLRPEGLRGPLAQSLEGYELYYESWGQTWERAALLKARPVAGDDALGREFMARIAPFVHRKYLDFSAIVEVRDMKQKINKEVRQKGGTYRDVKLGYGGIREIEFLVQALQLIYSGRDRTLREKNTLKALHTLAQKGLLTYQETADLSKAYVFLRTVEHRLQILSDLQTQTLPAGERELRALARRAGYLGQGKETDMLLRDYAMHTRNVRGIYDNLLGQTQEEAGLEGELGEYAVLLDQETGEREAEMVLAQYGFQDPAKANRNIRLLREGAAFVHQTPRSRRAFFDIFPTLFHEIINSSDPDMALNHLESYFAAQGSWEAFQTLAKQNLALVKALVTIFANSEYFSRMFVGRPGLLESLIDTRAQSGTGAAAHLKNDLAEALARADGIADKLDELRRFKHREEIRIGLADLMLSVPTPSISRSLSRLAEACLGAAFELALSEIQKRRGITEPSGGLAVIGVGKLGGRELTYGSDLDILFVFDEERAGPSPLGLTVFEYFSNVAEKTISYLATITREGSAYSLDTRLRPTGSKGPLVQSLSAFRDYYAGKAETWERQALVNSRFITGDRNVGKELSTALQSLIYRDKDPALLAGDIRAMRMRMENELAGEDAAHYNIKQGIGGLVDIEFLAQFFQLAYARGHHRLRVPGTYNALRALRCQEFIRPDDHRLLLRAYLFYRRLESRLRIVTNQSTNALNRDPAKLHALARRMGYQDDAVSAGQKLLAEYERMREEVREVFDRLVK